MQLTIITKDSNQTFNKNEISISSQKGYDCFVNLNFPFVLKLHYDEKTGKCVLINESRALNLLFKGQPLPPRLDIEKMCKLMVKDSDEFITIKVLQTQQQNGDIIQEQTQTQNVQQVCNDTFSTAKSELENRKAAIEKARVAIIKQVSYAINDLRHKISMNSKAGIFLHIGLFIASVILSFGVSNYLMGLPLKDAGTMIQMPVNIKLLLVYTVIIYALGLVLKQGMYLFLQNSLHKANSANSLSEKTLIVTAAMFFAGIYIINVLYYMAPGSMPVFAILMSLFFTTVCVILALACGYFKSDSVELAKELNKYEYREDFEQVMNAYRQWIERYVNNLSANKITNIKDRLFNLKIKAVGEIILGILTAPFLAYGVSNTLAMCFPDAAGWVRISGLRLSPVFLVLATFLIIFAFFSFVNGFLSNKKIQASNVLKNDGFSNYMQHATEIYGLQGAKKLDTDMRRSFIIGLCIIFIEFSMNISYFMQEIGADLGGIMLSCVAALVPTALLIAETYMLSQTKFETYASEEILSKID